MKNIREFLNLKRQVSLELSIILVSTPVIICIGVLVYSSMVYRGTLSVNNPTGVSTGPSAPAAAAFPPVAIALMLLSLIASLITFGFSVRAYKHPKDVPNSGEVPLDPMAVPPEQPDEPLQLGLDSTLKE